jgi:hypothetical protein
MSIFTTGYGFKAALLVHKIAHLLGSTHNTRFITLVDQFMPKWRFYKDELNKLPAKPGNWAHDTQPEQQ